MAQDEPDGKSVLPDLVDLVVEVWSPGNRTFELTIKRDAYANAGRWFLWEVELGSDGSGWVLIGQQLEHGCWVVLERVRVDDDVTVIVAPKPITLRACPEQEKAPGQWPGASVRTRHEPESSR